MFNLFHPFRIHIRRLIDISVVKAKLNQIPPRDDYEYFPVSVSAIKAFEAEWQIELPDEYRRLLLEIGPAFIAPLNEAISYWQNWFPPLPANWLSAPFPFTGKWTSILHNPDDPAELNDDVDLDEYDAEDAYLRENLRGALMLDEEGCGTYDYLVVSGPERGNVWVDDTPNSGEIYPFTLALSDETSEQRVSFFVWYMDWLDQYIISSKGNDRTNIQSPFGHR